MSQLELLESVVRALVDDPSAVRLAVQQTDHAVMVDIYVAGSDVGKVLGKGGAHASALRTLFTAIYGKNKQRMMLQVIDPRR